MSNAVEQYTAIVARMTALELLTEIIINPEYLTDSYYREFGNAIRARHLELLGVKS